MRPWWRYLAFSVFQLVRSGLAMVFGTALGIRPFAYWTFAWGFARGQLDAFPELFRAQMNHVKPDDAVLAGKRPESPQTFVAIPDA